MTFTNKSFWRCGTRFNLLESCHSNITLNTAPIVELSTKKNVCYIRKYV